MSSVVFGNWLNDDDEEEIENKNEQIEVCVDAVVSLLVVVFKLSHYWYQRAVQVKRSIENEKILEDHLH